MTSLTAAQLRKAASIRERLDKLEKQLTSILGDVAGPAPAKRQPPEVSPAKPKRKMSRAAKAKIAAAARARWAKAKAAGKRRL